MAKVVVLASYAQALLIFKGQLLARMTRQGHQVINFAPSDETNVGTAFAKIGVAFKAIEL